MTYWLRRDHARNVLCSLVLQPAMTVDLDHPALETKTIKVQTR